MFIPLTVYPLSLYRDQLDHIPPDAEEKAFGNSVYKITFEDRPDRPVFGHKYWFYLQDAVENVPEYIVRWENFVQYVLFQPSLLRITAPVGLTHTPLPTHRMAAEYGLHPIYKEEFHQVFTEHQEHPEFKPLLVRMKVVDNDGESAMDEDQWEAASMSPLSRQIH